jgi:hypothetical protein
MHEAAERERAVPRHDIEPFDQRGYQWISAIS